MKLDTKSVVFTAEELGQLTQHSREAATAISNIFDVLRQAGDRLGLEWEPHDNASVRDIVDRLSAEYNPGAVTMEVVAPYFAHPDNWQAAEGDKEHSLFTSSKRISEDG